MWWTGIPYVADAPGSDFSASMPPRSSPRWRICVAGDGQASKRSLIDAVRRGPVRYQSITVDRFGRQVAVVRAGGVNLSLAAPKRPSRLQAQMGQWTAHRARVPLSRHSAQMRSTTKPGGRVNAVPAMTSKAMGITSRTATGCGVDRAPPAPCSIRHADVGWLVKSYTASLVYSHSATPPW